MWRHGLSMSAIASRRDISRYAVRYHLRNASQKLGIESTGELRHFPGFALTSVRSAIPRKGDDMTDKQAELSFGPLGQVSMLTRNAANAEAWYRDKLQLPHIFTFGDLVFFDCGGTRLYIREVTDEQWRPSSILYFLVPDIDDAYATLTARGVTFQGAPHMIFRDDATGTEVWMAFFEDGDGNTLAVMARVPVPSPIDS
jgi:catechol 2,3-dioxygenase-like lactoylglutathione lyase family enzyme